jgi:hypothetical protein
VKKKQLPLISYTIFNCLPSAAEYLLFMACVDSKDIPRSLLPAGMFKKRETGANWDTQSYSFIIKRSANRAFNHHLVHLVTLDWLPKQEMIAQWTKTAITRLDEVFPDDNHQNRSLWTIYLLHVRYTLLFNMIDKDMANRMKLF